MKHFVQLILAAFVFCSAGVQAAEAPILRETFTCNFNEGQDMDDLMAARDFFLRQMEKLGMDPRQHFVWTPFKASVGFDFLWATNFPDLVTFAKETDAYMASAEGQAADARFAQVATCTSGLASRQLVYQADGEFEGNPAVINAFACNYQRGHGAADLGDLLNHAAGALGALDRADGHVAYAATPMTPGPNTADVYLYGVQGSLEDWAERTIALGQSAGGQSLVRHLNTILDCSRALFFGQRVIPKE